MIKILYIPIFIFAILFTACNNNHDEKMQEQISSAISLGHRHAIEIIALYENDEDITTKLIDIKEKEYNLRNIGNDSVANVYIHAFENYIRANSQSLSSEIFE